MNNTFDIKRFGGLLSKDVQENGKRYMLQFLAMLGIMMIVFTWISLDFYYNFERYPSYFKIENLDMDLLKSVLPMFLGFGVLMASTLMEQMGSKAKRISYLLIPASNFEKYISRWLVVTVGYVVAFFIALWLADAFRVAICLIKYPNLDVHLMDFSLLMPKVGEDRSGDFIFFDRYMFITYVGFYLFIQSLFVLGATFWEKLSFVKTFAAGFIIFALFLLCCNWAISLCYNSFNEFSKVLDSLETYDMFSNTFDLYCLFFSGFMVAAFINWILAFFRFRESEIIIRL